MACSGYENATSDIHREGCRRPCWREQAGRSCRCGCIILLFTHSRPELDVATQSTSSGWTLGKWVQYFVDAEGRDKIRNVTSLEISGTRLTNMITLPKLVRDLDGVE